MNKICSWNANSLRNKKEEFFNILDKNEIDIFAISEIKIYEHEANIFNHKNYVYLCKPRTIHGGGVALFIKKNIEYEEVLELNQFKIEHICIKIKYKTKYVYVINYYNPPDKIISSQMLDYIELYFKSYIICGDLNAKHKSIGCHETKESGNVLIDFVNNSKSIIMNNRDFTYFKIYNDKTYKEVLDLFVCSSDMANEFYNFKVRYDLELDSDHYPIQLDNNSDDNKEANSKAQEKKYDFSKVCWKKFKETLEKINLESILECRDVDKINDFIIESLHHAAKAAMPYKNNNKKQLRLPKYILNMIEARKFYKRIITKNEYVDPSIKNKLYTISRTIKEEINAVKNNKWNKFTEQFSKNPLSSKKFWNQVNIIKNGSSNHNDNIPMMKHDNQTYKSDLEKANLFASILSSTFKDNSNTDNIYDDNFKIIVNKEVKENIANFKNQEIDSSKINMQMLNKFLKKIKPTLSTGEDKVSNIMLKNVGNKFKQIILHLFRLSIKGDIPKRWKKVIVKMIPKKADNKADPKNYRPISLTNCLARLCERFVLEEIQEHLKNEKIIIKEQSGFRVKRQTKDNIFSVCQRNLEAFNRKKNSCVVFFDISKAFDKVWHNGLLYKMHKYKFKQHIINWIANFLQDRFFCVKINEIFSIEYKIETGVPQGGVLSPILFSIYINDIINQPIKHGKISAYSNLFADDLTASGASTSLNSIEKLLNKYLQKLEEWLRLWRLSINANKCQYILFTKNTKDNRFMLDLKLFNENIPRVQSLKFLGITLDSRMSFNKCVEETYDKCLSRLRIIKILSHKSWKLEQKTLINIYKSLIRTIIDYVAIVFPVFCETNKKK